MPAHDHRICAYKARSSCDARGDRYSLERLYARGEAEDSAKGGGTRREPYFREGPGLPT